MSAEWEFLVALNERLGPLKDPVEIQDLAVRLIGEHFQASRVHYAQIEGDAFTIATAYAGGVPSFPRRGKVTHFGRTILETGERGETLVVADARTDPRFTDDERLQLFSRDIAAFVVVPLIKEGRWIAAFAVHAATPRRWTRDQVALIEMTADRTWSAGERAHAEAALSRKDDRQAFLRMLSETMRQLADPARILEEACRLLGTHLHVDRVAYGEIDGEDCTVVNDYVDGLPSLAGRFRWTDLGGSRSAEILKGGALSVNDTSIEPHTAAEREALRAAGIGAYICPLLVKDGRFVASFGIHSREPRVWAAEEIALVTDAADRIWATLEHRKTETELHTNKERLEFLLRLNDALRPLSEPGEVQATAARLLGQHIGANRVGYAELDGSEFVIRHGYSHGVQPLTAERSGIKLGAEMRAALQRGEAVVVNSEQVDPRLQHGATLRPHQIAAFIGAPLIKGGRLVAVLGATHVTPRIWTASEVQLVRDVVERTWDAVERARAETALREQQQRLRIALEASSGGSWTWVAATNQVDWDERFRALYGFTADEPATADGWVPRVHDDDRARVMAVLDDVLASKTKESWECTFRLARPDGTTTWIQSRGRADRDDDGKVTRLAGLDLDFTQHRRMEEALQASREAEYDRDLRTLLETAAQGIVSVDANGAIVTANQAFDAMFGAASGALIGQPIERLMPTAFRDGDERGGGMYLVGTRINGSTFPIEVSVNHVPTAGGGRAFAFVTDITDRQRAAVALHERTAELEYRTTQLSRMASDLTLAERRAREQIASTLHDGLQQLLVLAALNLERHLKREAEGRASDGTLLTGAQLALEEAIAAARSLSFELFPPLLERSGLPAALTWLANWTQEKYRLEVNVIVDPRADSPRKEVRALLFESVRELLFNAVKHAETDGVTLEVALDAGDQLCITVSDQGVGFEPAELEQRSKAGQVGWGLFSIRERLTLLGGRFEIDSAPGKGTRVWLVAPRGPADTGAPIAAPIRVTSIGEAERMSSDAVRILIVDDHAVVRSALRQMLNERPEFSVVGDAPDGLEAITQAHALRPDVILMDVAMPHMDGIEATMRIRDELPGVQILGLSMQAGSSAARAMEQAGAEGYFVKGIDMTRLIDHLLAVHAVRRAGIH